MRFCPFCAQENSDEASECAHCGRGLPSLGPRTTALPTLPKKLASRPPPVRPLPRARGVPTALSGAGPSGAAVASEPERRRVGTLLGIATTVPAEAYNDAATRVESSPFDGPTTQTPRLEAEDSGEHTSPTERFDALSHVATNVRRPPTSTTTLKDLKEETSGEETAVGPGGGDDPPTAVDTPRVGAKHFAAPSPFKKLGSTPPLGARALDGPAPKTPPWAAPAAPSRPPPAPLPPPPGLEFVPLRSDPPESETNPGTKLPPEQSAPGIEAADFDAPPPMPIAPGAGLVPAVRYLLPLGKAVWARMQAQKAIKAKLHADQRLLDDALHDLGRAAWEERERPPELREELERADEDDGRRRDAEKEVARLDMSLAAERERFGDDEHRRNEDITAREADLKRLDADLAERRRAQRIEDKVFQTVASRLAVVEKRRDQLIAKAARADVMPPEKGGGPHTSANFRKQAEDAQREIDGIRPERDEAEARVRALDQPIVDLEQQLRTAREGLAQAQSELIAARQANVQTKQGLDAERLRNDEIRATADKGLRLRLTSTGTVLNLHRLDVPQYRKLQPIYARLDDLKSIAAAREGRIATLDAERRSFDRAALQRGLIVVGSAFGVALVLLVIIIILIAR